MLKIQGLQFSYSPEVGFTYPDFEINKGENLAILGPSGSGKSTLIQLISGWRQASAGKIELENKSISSYTLKELALKMAIVHQNMHFLPSLNVKENLVLGAQIGGKKVDDNFFEKIELLGLSNKLLQNPNTLSRGEQQRLSLLRAMAASPLILLADEPTASLDDKQCENVMNLMLDLCRESETALMVVTHDQRVKEKLERSISL